MEHMIQNMSQKLNVYEGNKLIATLNGYAFIDKLGYCIIIVYGEGKRDTLIKYLSKTLPSSKG